MVVVAVVVVVVVARAGTSRTYGGVPITYLSYNGTVAIIASSHVVTAALNWQ